MVSIRNLMLFIIKGVRKYIRIIIGFLQNRGRFTSSGTILVFSAGDQSMESEISLRLSFYCQPTPEMLPIDIKNKIFHTIFSPIPLLIYANHPTLTWWLVNFRPGTFDVDYLTNPLDGWAWTDLAYYTDPVKVNFSQSKHIFSERIRALRSQNRDRCYIFGTGPSLAKASQWRWDDGYRIVCNTIVRDPVLWNHIAPDFIVAGDAIHHFGFTQFAQAFRRDLKERLRDSDTLFVYPAQFHPIVRREFEGLEGKFVPIPTGWKKRVDIDLTRSFILPGLGNILPLMLLPLACTLSKEVYMWGFDGRSAEDQLFWKNSSKHSYPEYLEELHEAHPAFFTNQIPPDDPYKYVRTVHGDQLERCLRIAENRGWRFVMMHPSWTPTLQKRYMKDV